MFFKMGKLTWTSPSKEDSDMATRARLWTLSELECPRLFALDASLPSTLPVDKVCVAMSFEYPPDR